MKTSHEVPAITKDKWKFLLLGITGDLSKKKILPAISQFSELYKEDLDIDLIGYSRSKPEDNDIKDLLKAHSSDHQIHVNSIEYVQGEYDNPTFFTELLTSLRPNERLVVYLAIPPLAFLSILDTFCLYGNEKLDIVMEKPFGNNSLEADKILEKIRQCKLESSVHFFDHYTFKTSSIIPDEILSKIQGLDLGYVQTIQVSANETLDVRGRGGYYDSVGAIKDMLPAHLYSMLKMSSSLTNKNLMIDNFVIKNLALGQYENYLSDIEKTESHTETYFKATSISGPISITLESGKLLSAKNTEIKVSFEGGSIVWNIDPKRKLSITKGGDAQEFNLNIRTNYDHTNLFEALKNRENDKFLTVNDVQEGWKLYELIDNYRVENKVVPVRYSK